MKHSSELTDEEKRKMEEEVNRDIEADRLRDEYMFDLWQKLTAAAETRELSKEEKRDIHWSELHFGGREKLIKYRDGLAKQSL